MAISRRWLGVPTLGFDDDFKHSELRASVPSSKSVPPSTCTPCLGALEQVPIQRLGTSVFHLAQARPRGEDLQRDPENSPYAARRRSRLFQSQGQARAFIFQHGRQAGPQYDGGGRMCWQRRQSLSFSGSLRCWNDGLGSLFRFCRAVNLLSSFPMLLKSASRVWWSVAPCAGGYAMKGGSSHGGRHAECQNLFFDAVGCSRSTLLWRSFLQLVHHFLPTQNFLLAPRLHHMSIR